MIEELMAGLFTIESAEQAHIFPYKIEKYVRYKYEIEPWFKAMPPAMFAALERRLGWYHLVVATPV